MKILQFFGFEKVCVTKQQLKIRNINTHFHRLIQHIRNNGGMSTLSTLFEKTPGKGRHAQLFIGKHQFVSTKSSLIPNEKSLKMNILCVTFISDGWVNCLNPLYETLHPLQYGWKLEKIVLEQVWLEGNALPCPEELNVNLDDRIDLIPTEIRECENRDDSSDDESVCISDVEFYSNEQKEQLFDVSIYSLYKLNISYFVHYFTIFQ